MLGCICLWRLAACCIWIWMVRLALGHACLFFMSTTIDRNRLFYIFVIRCLENIFQVVRDPSTFMKHKKIQKTLAVVDNVHPACWNFLPREKPPRRKQARISAAHYTLDHFILPWFCHETEFWEISTKQIKSNQGLLAWSAMERIRMVQTLDR